MFKKKVSLLEWFTFELVEAVSTDNEYIINLQQIKLTLFKGKK